MEIITQPVYTAPNRVTCIPMYDCLMVYTLYDPFAGGQAVTVMINGVTYTGVSGAPGANQFQLIPRGSPTVMWSGRIALGNLPFAAYPWSVSQTVSGKTWTDNGTYWSRPGLHDDFAFVFEGCDFNSYLYMINPANLQTVPGYWQHVKRRAQASAVPFVGVFFVDDLGYVDSVAVSDNGATYPHVNQSGLVSITPISSNTLNNYLIGWMAILGMLGPEQTEYSNSDLGTYFQLQYVLWGREENRAWCRKNLNLWPQWGDHEFINDLGWDSSITAYPNRRWASAGVDGNGALAWDAVFGLGMPPSAANRNTAARHWVMELGPVCLAAMDRISSSVGGGISYAPPTTGKSVFGQNQIFDTLDKVQEFDKPFTFFGMSVSLKYYGDGPNFSISAHGGQHSLFDHTNEFGALISNVAQTPPALGEWKNNSRIINFLSGDHHFGQVIWFGEGFYDIHNGTANGSTNFSSSALVAENEAPRRGMTVKYAQKFHAALPGVFPEGHFHGITMEVYGSRFPKECRAYLRNHFDDDKFTRKFVQYRGNEGFDLLETTPAPPRLHAGGTL